MTARRQAFSETPGALDVDLTRARMVTEDPAHVGLPLLAHAVPHGRLRQPPVGSFRSASRRRLRLHAGEVRHDVDAGDRCEPPLARGRRARPGAGHLAVARVRGVSHRRDPRAPGCPTRRNGPRSSRAARSRRCRRGPPRSAISSASSTAARRASSSRARTAAGATSSPPDELAAYASRVAEVLPPAAARWLEGGRHAADPRA